MLLLVAAYLLSKMREMDAARKWTQRIDEVAREE